ncbi:family 20 glycosylhydrolase [bacterium]|nr:family 20 glycosylhydrolase [bacterium]
MKLLKVLCAIALCGFIAGCASMHKTTVGPQKGETWRALHLLNYNTDADLEALGNSIPALAEMGLNVLVLEVDYHFAFEKHPELRMPGSVITKEGAGKFAALCRQYNIRLIPQFQCLGHQSWTKTTFPLLIKYPQFDLTPGAFPNNEGLYCREWDMTNPDLNPIIFSLMGEIIDAFGADALHVGMDEIFLIGSDKSPSTKGKDPAKLFAKAVNDYHNFLVKQRGVEMLMWADRFIDGTKYNFGKWEASENGTAPALNMVPKDIILCPWHYEARDSYPSIQEFLIKGFRVLPASWNKVDASQKLIQYSIEQNNSKMLGHLFTTWGSDNKKPTEYPPLVEGLKVMTAR